MKLDKMMKQIKANKHKLKRQDRRRILQDLWWVYKDSIEGGTRAEKRRNWKALWKEMTL